MASWSDGSLEIDEEVKELLRNYKHKKATIYEPCTLENFRECLIGLSEELALLNINYIFNPHIDVDNGALSSESLIQFINSMWTLLHYHKSTMEKVEHLVEQNNILERTNKQLNGFVGRLKEKSSFEKNESRACVASAQRISDHYSETLKTLTETRVKLTQVTKQKESTARALRNEIAKLKLENEKLLDRLRNKSDSFTPCSEVCDSTLLRFKERERKQKAIIVQLQTNNQELLREVIAMKEELLLSGLHDFKLDGKNEH